MARAKFFKGMKAFHYGLRRAWQGKGLAKYGVSRAEIVEFRDRYCGKVTKKG